VAAPGDAVAAVGCNEGGLEQAAEASLEAIFRAEYKRIARVLARVTRDPARAEELAVEVFLKWERTPRAHGEHARGWLYRTAVRSGLKELRAESRRSRYERLFVWVPQGRTNEPKSPERLHAESEGQRQVRRVLSKLPRRQAELLVLRSEGLSYSDIAAAVGVGPGSVGTLLARAQRAFRKEFVSRYGEA
jgi:RNA polymerase sigma-70 factor (ECF subfamily)